MELKKDSAATFNSYCEYYYAAAANKVKVIQYENVKDSKSKGSPSEAYFVNGGEVSVKLNGESDKIESYKVEHQLHNLNTRQFERYINIGINVNVTATYAEAN